MSFVEKYRPKTLNDVKGQNEAIEKLRFFLKKFPKKKASADNGKFIFFKFSPIWWKFSDWKHPEGKAIYTSDGKVVITKKP